MGKRGGPGSVWSLPALGDGLLRREMRLESPKPGSGNPHFLDNKNVDLCCYNQSFQRQNPCNVIALTLKIQRQRQTDLFPPDYRFCHFVYIWLAAVLALLQIGKFAFSTHSDQGSRHPEDKVVGWQLLQGVDVTKNFQVFQKFKHLLHKWQLLHKRPRHIEMYFPLNQNVIPTLMLAISKSEFT